MARDPIRLAGFAAALAALCVIASPDVARADVLPYGLKIEKVLDNTVELGDLAISPDGEIWLLERATGVVRVFVTGKQAGTFTAAVDATCGGGLLDVAFAQDYPMSGRAFLSYLDSAKHYRVDKVRRSPTGYALDGALLDFGLIPGGCRPGGGLDVGPDGKLYVSVGDMEDSAKAQVDAQFNGKVLRVNPDGSVPSDNPSGTLVWSKGFRDGTDLTINPTTARTNGTVYLSDVGAGSIHDELNVVRPGGNYGWDIISGSSGGVYDDPLVAYTPAVSAAAVAALTGTALGTGSDDSLVYALVGQDVVRQAFLTGPDKDSLSRTALFYDPDGDRDGSPDAGCPTLANAVTEGNDGWLYAANKGTTPGVWRAYRDLPGPREVSGPGSPFRLTVDKSGSDVIIGWENLGRLDTGRPVRNAGQRVTRYQIWKGALPIAGSYSHSALLGTDGTADGRPRLTATIAPDPGSQYYLVGAQGENLEGSLGKRSEGTERPGQTDYCNTIGWGKTVGACAQPWINPVNGKTLYLTDYNPNSPTYLQQLTMADFRGRVVRMDVSAIDCYYCSEQAYNFHTYDLLLRDRDAAFVTVMMNSYTAWNAIPPGSCASWIASWATQHSELGPILCDTDLNADGRADVGWSWFLPSPQCGGTPHNFYIDQGHVIYRFVCGGEGVPPDDPITIYQAMRDQGPVNPETCE